MAKIVGIDEVGTGAWCGAAYVAGFCEDEDWEKNATLGLKDSKELDKPVIYALAKDLARHEHRIEIISVEDIDEKGLIPCLLHAYKVICKHFLEKYPDCQPLIDGNKTPNGVRCCAIPDGDSKVPHIMAAAIIAKAARDAYMIEMAKQYPYYKWETNVGYGTADHIEGLNAHGLSPIHRVSFKPVRKFLRNPPDPVGANPVTKELYSAWKKKIQAA